MKCYILFEYDNSNLSIANKDIMGVTLDKEKAIEWVNKNPEYRTYKETKILE